MFKFTEAAQARLEDLLTRRKDGGLTTAEQAELDALAELDRIFTYIKYLCKSFLTSSSVLSQYFQGEHGFLCQRIYGRILNRVT